MTGTTTATQPSANANVSTAPTMMFVNLPVKDLHRSVEFFTALGFSFNEQLTDEHATCMIINETCGVMLLTRSRFRDFTTKALTDATTHTEVICCITADSRQAVDELVDAALQAGGRPSKEAMADEVMYSRSFHDLDGHLWEAIWMDPAVIDR